MSGEIKTQGTQLWKVASATTSVEIGNILSFNPPSPASDEIEITNLASTAKEFLQGLRDYGEASFEMNFSASADFQALVTDFQAGTVREWLIGFADATTAVPTVSGSAFGSPATTRSWVKFSGFIKAMPITGQTNSVTKNTLTIRVSGTPTFTWKA